ncbi:MAG: glycosyltransferase family 2 protein [Planctomycetota bacterium]
MSIVPPPAADATPPDLSVVIVSYNTREMTLECLDTLAEALTRLDAEVFVVDNASTDGSVDAVRAAYPDAVVIANDDNAGFGAANNQAFARAAGRYLLLLNSDAFPEPGALEALVAFAERHPDAGVVGPRTLCPDGSLQQSCFHYPSPWLAWRENLWLHRLMRRHPRFGDMGAWPHDEVREVDFVIGACMLVRRDAYDAVGGFDERFFMYAEESDWQKRIGAAGFGVWFTPDAVVTHIGGASGAKDKARINNHFFDSLDAYTLKHHGRFGLVNLRAAMAIGCAIRAAGWCGAGLLARASDRRETAAAKLRLMRWLVWRQLTHWPRSAPA